MIHPYADIRYAQAFSPSMQPVAMPSAGLHVLSRPISNTGYCDAMGPYPLSPVSRSVDFASDFEALREEGLVSLVMVSDPFYFPAPSCFEAAFDRSALFKQHFVYDYSQPQAYSSHHRYEVRRAHKSCDTSIITLHDHLDAWYELYSTLILRHGITGIQAFSRDYFVQIAALEPVMVGAFIDGVLVSAHLWFIHEGVVYSHLAASSDAGYRARAAYAVYDSSIQHFASMGMRVIDFGAGAGSGNGSQGLTFLKQGFSTGTVPVYLCGKILDSDTYKQLSAAVDTSFFPAYRAIA